MLLLLGEYFRTVKLSSFGFNAKAALRKIETQSLNRPAYAALYNHAGRT